MHVFRLSGTLPSVIRSASPSTRRFCPPPVLPPESGCFCGDGKDIDHLANFGVAPEYRVDSPLRAFSVTSSVKRLSTASRASPVSPSAFLPVRPSLPPLVARCQRFGDLWLTCRTFIRLRISRGRSRSSCTRLRLSNTHRSYRRATSVFLSAPSAGADCGLWIVAFQ